MKQLNNMEFSRHPNVRDKKIGQRTKENIVRQDNIYKERNPSKGEAWVRRNDVDLDRTGVTGVPPANLPSVAVGCHGMMSQPDVTAGCHRKMLQQNVTANSHSKM